MTGTTGTETGTGIFRRQDVADARLNLHDSRLAGSYVLMLRRSWAVEARGNSALQPREFMVGAASAGGDDLPLVWDWFIVVLQRVAGVVLLAPTPQRDGTPQGNEERSDGAGSTNDATGC